MAGQKTKNLEKRNFFEVRVPLTAAKIYLYAASMDELTGRVVKLDLTRSLRGKSLELRARIKKDGEKLIGEPFSLILAGSYVRRMMRKGTDYVEDSFEAECRDSRVIVKTFMITRNKVPREIRNKLRETAREFLLSQHKNRTAKEVMTSIITNKLQKELSLKLKKIYPLAVCEIRWFEILKENASGEKTEKNSM